jgi:glyoxylase-like metal-dependent hydrolase (beta-lactamase superfamily II)
MTTRVRVTEVAPGVHLCRARDVNWTVLTDARGSEVTLVDAGYPGHLDAVVASLETLGRRPEQVAGILLTHAHVDHQGSVPAFVERWPTPVLTDPVEVPHVRRERLEQATPAEVVANLWRPGAAGWAARIVRAGATRDVAVPAVAAVTPGEPLDLPGRPVPVPTHGHTSGHTAYWLPDLGVVLTGDELVTGHALSRTEGPQRLPAFFRHGDGDEEAALTVLAGVAADVVVPGHGDVWRGPLAEAVRRLRAG